MSSSVHFSLSVKRWLKRSSVSSGRSSTRSRQMVWGWEVRSTRATLCNIYSARVLEIKQKVQFTVFLSWYLEIGENTSRHVERLTYVGHNTLMYQNSSLFNTLTFSWSSLVLMPSGTLCCQTSWNSLRLNLTAFWSNISATPWHTLSSFST